MDVDEHRQHHDRRAQALAEHRLHLRTTHGQTVKCSLHTVLPLAENERLLAVMDDAVLNVTQLAAAASRLANFHLARVLATGLALPAINAALYEHCMLAFTERYCRPAGTPEAADAWPVFFLQSVRLQRRAAPLAPINIHGLAHTVELHAQSMAKDAQNHLRLRIEAVMRKRVLHRLREATAADDSVSANDLNFAANSIVWAAVKREDEVFDVPWQRQVYQVRM